MAQKRSRVSGSMIKLTQHLIHCDSGTFLFVCLFFPPQLAITVYYLAMVGHTLSIVSLILCLIIFSYFK